MTRRTALSAAFLVAAASGCLAQPKFIVTTNTEDIDSTGNKSLGRLAEYANNDVQYVPYIWERGVGYTRIPGVTTRPTMVRGSSDLSALVSDLPNTDDWGNLNCFAGYCFGSMTNCTLGEPLPPPNPCWTPVLAHHWTAGTGWVSGGSLQRFLDAPTGRYYGGTRCDGNINYPSDISGNGRYIVGGAWSARLTTTTGGPGFGLCGDFLAFKYDSQTGVFAALPSASGSTTTNAFNVSDDGNVVTGYDYGAVPDGAGGFFPGRRSCVWTNGVQTLIDPYSNSAATTRVNGPGTVIAGVPEDAFNVATFGAPGIKLVKWVRQPNNAWVPQNLGRVVDRERGLDIDILVKMFVTSVSDDGNTIIGTAWYNMYGPGGLSRVYIWRPSINNGVPIDLMDYIQTIDPSNPLLADGLIFNQSVALNADGKAIMTQLRDGRNTCTNGATSHMTVTAGILYLNGSSIPCDAPRIALGPTDWTDTQYTPFGVSLNVAASGSWPLSYQWQREDSSAPGVWMNLTQSCMDFTRTEDWDYEGTMTPQLRIGQGNCGGGRGGRYRVVISNSCGSVASEPATVTFAQPNCPPACPADFNGDGFLDYTDFDDFVVAFEAGLDSGDFNLDGFLDFTDFDAFVTAFEAGC